MTHPPSKEGGSSRRFCCCGCFPFPFLWGRASAWSDEELLPHSKDLRFGGGVFLLCVGLGGATAGGLCFSAGAAFAGEALRGLAGVGGFIPQLDIRMSSSEHPSHPNSPRAAQQGVLAAHVSVGRRERSHSRSPDRMAHPRRGLSSISWYRADRAMLNSAVPNLYRMRSPATSAGFTSTSTTCDSAIHKCVHKTRS